MLKALTKPWKRFQDIIDAIDQTLTNIRETAQYTGLLEEHANLLVNRKNLELLQKNSASLEKIAGMFEELRSTLRVKSIQFSKPDDIRQAECALRQAAEERLNEPAMQQQEVSSDQGTLAFSRHHILRTSHFYSAPCSYQLTETIETDPTVSEASDDFDFHRELFSELHQDEEQAYRSQRAKEELPEMRSYRAEKRNFTKSEIALAWAESLRSEMIWVDGYQLLTRADFNACFIFPLLQLVESKFDKVITLRHFCEGARAQSDQYLVMMQSLVSQFLRNNPSIAQRKRAVLSRERTSSITGLWSLVAELLEASNTQCTILIIGGIDHLLGHDDNAKSTIRDMTDQLHVLLGTASIIKIVVTQGLPEPQRSTVEGISSLAVSNHRVETKRTFSFDAIQSSLPVMSMQLTEIQERRCRSVNFMQLLMLYTPGITIYTYDESKLRAFVVSSLSEQVRAGQYVTLLIRAWSIDHDGTCVCKRYHDLEVNYFAGQKEVKDLKYVPAGFVSDEASQREALAIRGRLYWSLSYGGNYRCIMNKQVIKVFP